MKFESDVFGFLSVKKNSKPVNAYAHTKAVG